ncbi:MAG: hypothetical protein N4A47_01870 [Clostridia bacterium]|jgi:hypothetical protein|nr:hypothetical protein [Clostridia bacterium]
MNRIKELLSEEYKEKLKENALKRLIELKEESINDVIEIFDVTDKKEIELLNHIGLKVSDKEPSGFYGNIMSFNMTKNEIEIHKSKGEYAAERGNSTHEWIHVYRKILHNKRLMTIYNDEIIDKFVAIKPDERSDEPADELLKSMHLKEGDSNILYTPSVVFLRALEIFTGRELAKDIIKENMTLGIVKIELAKHMGIENAERAYSIFDIEFENPNLYHSEMKSFVKDMMKEKGIKEEECESRFEVLMKTYFDKDINFLDANIVSKARNIFVMEDKDGNKHFYKIDSGKTEKLNVEDNTVNMERFDYRLIDNELIACKKGTEERLSIDEISAILEEEREDENQTNLEDYALINEYLAYKFELGEEKQYISEYLKDAHTKVVGFNDFSDYQKVTFFEKEVDLIISHEEKAKKIIKKAQSEILRSVELDIFDRADSVVESILNAQEVEIEKMILNKIRNSNRKALEYMTINTENIIGEIKESYLNALDERNKAKEEEVLAKVERKAKIDEKIEEQNKFKYRVYRKLYEMKGISKIAKFIKEEILNDRDEVLDNEDMLKLVSKSDYYGDDLEYISDISKSISKVTVDILGAEAEIDKSDCELKTIEVSKDRVVEKGEYGLAS